MDRRAALAPLLALPVLLFPVLALPSGATPGPCASPTIRGTDDDDLLQGTAGHDVIDGLVGDDEISGLGGDDVLCGGPGSDRLSGGEGADRLHGGTDAKVLEDTDYYVFYGDTLAGGPGDDLLDLGDDPRSEGPDDVLSYADSTSGVVLDLPAGTATGEGTDQVVGEVEEIRGSDHDDVLVGTGTGRARSGTSVLDVRIPGHENLVVTSGKRWFVRGTDGPNRIGGSGRVPIVVHGLGGDDRLYGSSRDDVLDGEPGYDRARGYGGDDRYVAVEKIDR